MNEAISIARIRKFRDKFDEKDLDAAIVTKRENILYLSGFTGTSGYVVISRDRSVLLVDFRYTEQAKLQAPAFEVIQFEGNATLAVNELLNTMNAVKVGVEDLFITYNKYLEYKERFAPKELIPLMGALEELRFIKDGSEIEIIEKAVKIADDTFSHILKYIRPGIAEIEIAAEMEYYMRKLGAKGASFETIVASGYRSSMPHGVASEKKIEAGDVITLDFGAIYEDYCSDMTRTVFLGEPKDDMKKIYNIVLKAQVSAIEEALTGLTGNEIDKVARDHIKNNGYENNFGHGLGHGVGLEIHEEPRLSPSGKLQMEDGMVVTVEPGIYVPGLGGVRIEDIIVFKGGKPQILTSSTKELIVL